MNLSLQVEKDEAGINPAIGLCPEIRDADSPTRQTQRQILMRVLPPALPVASTVSQPRRLTTCRVDELRPHPGYVRNHIAVPASQLSLLAQAGEIIFTEPLSVTRDGIIMDGRARWHLAQQQGRATLPALEYDLSESVALQWMLQKQRRGNGLNDFNRICLALELEPWLREQARCNQQLGGQQKGSSNLAEADRLDVRSRIAKAAGVSTGNLSKARCLISYAHPQVLEALRADEVSIHQASTWSHTPDQQLKQLHLYQNRRGITRTIRTLLNAHRRPAANQGLDLQHIASAITVMPPEQREGVLVAEVKVSGSVLLLSPALRQALTRQGEFQS